MSRNIVETIIGAVVLLVAVGFLVWGLGRTSTGGSDGISLSATFDNIGSVGVGSDVRISGIPVGSVSSLDIDPLSFRAKIQFVVRDDLEIPADSSVSIASSGLLGGNYLSLLPGGDIDLLEDGDQVAYTQSAVDLMGLLGKAVFGAGRGGS